MRYLICIAIGLIIALIITAIMKSKLKTEHWNDQARQYIDEDSFKLFIATDNFMYDNVERSARPQDNDRDNYKR